jgi:hypothetical protein
VEAQGRVRPVFTGTRMLAKTPIDYSQATWRPRRVLPRAYYSIIVGVGNGDIGGVASSVARVGARGRLGHSLVANVAVVNAG